MEAPRPPEQKKVFLDSERNTVFVGAADGSGQLQTQTGDCEQRGRWVSGLAHSEDEPGTGSNASSPHSPGKPLHPATLGSRSINRGHRKM
jgi:hypothetical protein